MFWQIWHEKRKQQRNNTDESDWLKFRYPSKILSRECKANPHNEREYLQMIYLIRGYILNIEIFKLKNKVLIKNGQKCLNRHFSKVAYKQAHERYSTSLIISGFHAKVIIRYHFIIRYQFTKIADQKDNNEYSWRCRGISTHIICSWECKVVQHFGNQFWCPIKLLCDPHRNFTLRYSPKRNESVYLKLVYRHSLQNYS